jgi:hypothetical protein
VSDDMKPRIYSMTIWLTVMTALASSLVWPSSGFANVATLAMVVTITIQAVSVLAFGTTLAQAEHENADKRYKSIKSLRTIVAAREKRSTVWRWMDVVQCVSLSVLCAYVGMMFGAVLYAFLSMVIRLQYVAARELLDKVDNPAQSPAPSTI